MKMQPNVFDVEKVRADFPFFSRNVAKGETRIYLDSAATTQKPQAVIDALVHFLTTTNANVHRGVYDLSQKATTAYEDVRKKVCRFLKTKDEGEVIYTSGTTDALNLVMQSWGRDNVGAGDTIVVTRMEHHANFVPWQALAIEKGAKFHIVELNEDDTISEEAFAKALELKPKIVAMTLMSNVTGVVNPIAQYAKAAKEIGAIVVVDGAQGMAHLPLGVSDLGPIDFLAFSSHKICGPSSVGILWGRRTILEKMRPYRYGGDMISRVYDQKSEWNELPWKFEAGTPPMESVVGFGAALDYIESLGRENLASYEHELLVYAKQCFSELSGVKLLGPKNGPQGALLSFIIEGVHPHDVATFLDTLGIAVRAGHHCAQPFMAAKKVSATTRASLTFYNTKSEIDFLVEGIKKTRDYFQRGSK